MTAALIINNVTTWNAFKLLKIDRDVGYIIENYGRSRSRSGHYRCKRRYRNVVCYTYTYTALCSRHVSKVRPISNKPTVLAPAINWLEKKGNAGCRYHQLYRVHQFEGPQPLGLWLGLTTAKVRVRANPNPKSLTIAVADIGNGETWNSQRPGPYLGGGLMGSTPL